jgi:phospholipid-transporting ATPase
MNQLWSGNQTPLLTRSKSSSLVEKFRTIDLQREDQPFCSNSVKTSKYTWLNFVPKNLFEQFKKNSNIYFVFICVMQTRPSITISGGYPANLMPLCLVLIMSMLKDGYEDFQRFKKDKTENNKKVFIF